MLLARNDWLAQRWLAKDYLPPSIERSAKLRELIIFLLIVANIVVFSAIYSNCVVYAKTIIYLGLGE